MKHRKGCLWLLAVFVCVLTLQSTVFAAQTKAVDVHGSSEVSSEVSEGKTIKRATTEKATLAAPQVKITNESYGVWLTWNKISKSKGYRVGRALISEPYYTFISTLKSKKKVSYTDKTAVSGRPYYYTVYAYTKSNGKYVYGKNNHYKNVFLSAPKKPVLKNNANGVSISWDKVEGAGFYQIFRWANNSKDSVLFGSVDAKYTSVTDKSAQDGVSYK